MKSLVTTILLVLIFSNQAHAQTSKPVTKSEVKKLVHKIADSLAFYYVDLEMGKQIGAHLKASEKEGKFASIEDPKLLAVKLTEDLRSLNGDLHLSVLHRPLGAPEASTLNQIENNLRARNDNFGLTEAKILTGNIGYLKIATFSNWDYLEETKSVMAASMKFLENADAIIFDVRDNRGGVPNLVAYLCSYLFEGEPVHLAQYYHRYRDSGYGLYTEENIVGERIPDVPVFVLVNNRSASAAEEFAYFLKYQKRATIVGDTTAGAGYGAMSHRLNDRFTVSISSEEDINPVTGSNFEQIGVFPDVATDDDDAFSKALELSEKAGADYRIEKTKRQQDLLLAFNSITAQTDLVEIERIIRECHQVTLITNNDINGLGYDYLTTAPTVAEILFKINTELYPASSNVYDSYGDGLAANGKLKAAADNYRKAIAIGEQTQSRDLALYKANLANIERQLPDHDPELTAITNTLNDYIEGTANGEVARLENAFHQVLNLYSIANDTLNITSGTKYKTYFESGEKRNRIGKIISIDYENDAAIAEIEVAMPGRGVTYTDYLLLMKIQGAWKIIHKSYTKKVER